MNSKMDPMERAIADYFKTQKASKLRVFSPMFEEDQIPLTILFRSYKSMPKILPCSLKHGIFFPFLFTFPLFTGHNNRTSFKITCRTLKKD